MRLLAEAVFEAMLYFGGTVVGSAEGGVAVHADMRFDGNAVTDTTSTDIVWFADIGAGTYDFLYLALRISRQRTLGQFVHAATQQVYGHLDEHAAYNNGG